MKKLHLGIILLLSVVMAYFLFSVASSKEEPRRGRMIYSLERMQLKMNIRNLFEDQIAWTRHFIISSLLNLDDYNNVKERLLNNQNEIAAAIKPYYGDDFSARLSTLLNNHILILENFVKILKLSSIDDELIMSEEKLWYANSDDMAILLSSINPNWVQEDLMEMFYKYLEFTQLQIVSRISKDWEKEIDAYDQAHEDIMKLADYLSEGIVKQFPDKFK